MFYTYGSSKVIVIAVYAEVLSHAPIEYVIQAQTLSLYPVLGITDLPSRLLAYLLRDHATVMGYYLFCYHEPSGYFPIDYSSPLPYQMYRYYSENE